MTKLEWRIKSETRSSKRGLRVCHSSFVIRHWQARHRGAASGFPEHLPQAASLNISLQLVRSLETARMTEASVSWTVIWWSGVQRKLLASEPAVQFS